VLAVHKAVPQGIPEQFRADVCQDIICAILEGEMNVGDLDGGDIKSFVASARKVFADKWKFMRLDAPIPGMDGKTFMETI
jgi:hypothetical protein